MESKQGQVKGFKAPRLAWRVGDFCAAVGISRSHLYQLMKQEKIRTVTLGGRRLIPDSERARLLGEAA